MWLENDVLDYLNFTPQRDCEQLVHRTLADGAQLDDEGKVQCLIEIKGRRLFGADTVIGNLLRMFNEDGSSLDAAWQRLIRSRVPYMFVIAFHRATSIEQMNALYNGINDSPIYDWLVIIGHRDQCTYRQSTTLSEFCLSKPYGEAIKQELKHSAQFKYTDLMGLLSKSSRELRGDLADKALKSICHTPKNLKPQCITKLPDIARRINHLFYEQGKTARQILQQLNSENITCKNKPLIDVAHVTNRLPPKATRHESYAQHQSVLQAVFVKAYESGSCQRPKSLSKITAQDAACINQAVDEGNLPAELGLKITALQKWYTYHKDHDALMSAKHKARYQFITQRKQAASAEQGEQGELWEYGNAKRCDENRQLITELQAEVALLKKALTLIAEVVS
jgi:hypothetical protein